MGEVKVIVLRGGSPIRLTVLVVPSPSMPLTPACHIIRKIPGPGSHKKGQT